MIALVLFALVPSFARAQEQDPQTAEARLLFERGRELADDRRFSEAAEAFTRSLELVAHPSTMFNLGACWFALGRHVEAIAMFERYLREGDPAIESTGIADAERMVSLARRAVAELTIEVLPEDASVTVDGVALEGGAVRTLHVNPGPHVLRAEAEGRVPSLIEIEAQRGRAIRRAVHLASARLPGELIVHVSDRPDARIRVDGHEIGRGTVSRELPAGAHVVAIESPGTAPYERRVELDWNERLRVDVTLAERGPSTVLEEPGFWIGAGGALLAAGIAVLIGALVVDNAPEADGGTTGVVLMPRWSGASR